MEALLNKRRNMREVYHGKIEPPKQPDKPVTLKPEKVLMTEADFATFWESYPIKEEKKKSHEKFMKLPRTLLPKILDSIAQNKVKNKKWKE